jgi:hypothetical protein
LTPFSLLGPLEIAHTVFAVVVWRQVQLLRFDRVSFERWAMEFARQTAPGAASANPWSFLRSVYIFATQITRQFDSVRQQGPPDQF